jgi:hypothetical protein
MGSRGHKPHAPDAASIRTAGIRHRAVREQGEVLADHRRSCESDAPEFLLVSRCHVLSVDENFAGPVGSIRRLIILTSVDFPEPDRPVAMKVSPPLTEKLTSLTPTVVPLLSENFGLAMPLPQHLQGAVGFRTEELIDNLKVMTGWSPAGIGPLVQINGRILWINFS